MKTINGQILKEMLLSGSNNLYNHYPEIDALNVFPVPDGDTGTNMNLTFKSATKEVNECLNNNFDSLGEAISKGALRGARGNSGVIISQFFAGISKGLKDKKKADALTFGKALEEGVKQAYASVMTPTEGTILTVARESVEYAVKRVNSKSTVQSLFADLVRYGLDSAL